MLYCAEVVSKRVWGMHRNIEACLDKRMVRNFNGRDEGHVKRVREQRKKFLNKTAF